MLVVVRMFAALLKLLLMRAAFLLRRARVVPKSGWVSVDVEGPVVDIAERRRLWDLRSQQPLSLYEFGELVKTVEKDARVKGVLVTIRGFEGGMATATSMRELLGRVKSSGRLVVAHPGRSARTRRSSTSRRSPTRFTSGRKRRSRRSASR